MAVEQNAGGIVVTGEHIEIFRLLAGMRGVAMDIRGLKPTRGFSSLKFAAEYGVKAKSKRAALEGLVEVMKTVDPEWEPTGTILKALEG